MADNPEKLLKIFRSLTESPMAKEAVIRQELEIAKQDPEVAQFVKDFHFDGDRSASLERFIGADFQKDVVNTIRNFFGHDTSVAICEIGGGNGFLVVSLIRAGYTNVDILEPASEYISGTGYFRGLPESNSVGIYNDADVWYASEKKYDLIITNACIHHFSNPAVVASQIRLKVKDNGRWLAFSEYFSTDFEDTASQINNHRHAVLYGLYEWPYSAKLYAAMLESAGFVRKEIAPVNPSGTQKKRLSGIAWRGLWRLLCSANASWYAYGILTWFVRNLARHALRRVDPAYMMFEARPIRWQLVGERYSREATNADHGAKSEMTFSSHTVSDHV
jgi:SAM-dependent methyltransferase